LGRKLAVCATLADKPRELPSDPKMFDPDFVWSFFKQKDERYGVKLAEAEAKVKREAEQKAKREIAAARKMAREAEAT